MSDPAPRVFALPLEEIPAMPGALGGGLSAEERALRLARALASSPIWREMGGATLVVRHAPTVIGLIGHFDDGAVARMEALPEQLRVGLPRVRYVDYAQVEADCQELGSRLAERLGQDELRHLDFIAIPRGGLIVLGMLAYFLDLRPSQLTSAARGDRRPLVVVDDCSVSGIRFGEFLAGLPERPVIFAPLYSHPDLRSAIEAREPRVISVVSAQDLHDHAPMLLGSDYSAWRERWMGRPGHEGYWIGRPDRLCFPWSETDVDFWNPVAGKGEVAWRLVSPDLCVKNRVTAAAPEAPRIQVQPKARGPLGPATTTLFADLDESLIVANVATGEAIELRGVAAAMWRGLVDHGDPEEVVFALREEYDVEEEMLARDLGSFIREMENRGFLSRREHADRS